MAHKHLVKGECAFITRILCQERLLFGKSRKFIYLYILQWILETQKIVKLESQGFQKYMFHVNDAYKMCVSGSVALSSVSENVSAARHTLIWPHADTRRLPLIKTHASEIAGCELVLHRPDIFLILPFCVSWKIQINLRLHGGAH